MCASLVPTGRQHPATRHATHTDMNPVLCFSRRLSNNNLQDIPFGLLQFDNGLWIVSLAEGNFMSCIPKFPDSVTLDARTSTLEVCKVRYPE